jgi:2'-deoxynucleoside 5'-phosphate N-hydrolase
MEIYLAIKYHADQKNRSLIENIVERLHSQGHSVTCAVSDFEVWGEKTFEPRELLLMAFKAIDNSDLVLIESSEKGMGVGIEAGYAFAKGKRIVTIAESGADISINLRSLSQTAILYSTVFSVGPRPLWPRDISGG